MIDLSKLNTEQRNQNTYDIDTYTPFEIVKTINTEDKLVAFCVEKELESIAKVVELASDVIRNNGRIIYIGAGTSGRLGILDAVECPPTYSVDDNTIVGLIAGGTSAFVKAVEGAEDSQELAVKDLKDINLSPKDLVVGIAASGRTPYVIGGLKYATKLGAKTTSISICENADISKLVDVAIEVVVGPEVVTGSTRMKAGTAQKLILNMISTSVMILNGKVYQNLMVDVQQTNLKLVQRAINIVVEATSCDFEVAKATLLQANGSAKIAITMILLDVDLNKATNILNNVNGSIRLALDEK